MCLQRCGGPLDDRGKRKKLMYQCLMVSFGAAQFLHAYINIYILVYIYSIIFICFPAVLGNIW